MESINDNIKTLTKEIGLPGIRRNFEILLDEFKEKDKSYDQFLYKLLEIEFASRTKNRKASRIRQAMFPYKKYLDELKLEELPGDAKTKLPELENLDFIKHGRNIILAGNPGTGKTHIAIGLGIKACLNDFKVHFTTVPRLNSDKRKSL